MEYCTTCGQKTKKQSDNLFVCASHHENYINPIPGSTVFIVKNDKVLYGKRTIEPAGINVVGGFIELHETAEECALRECKEEFGVNVRIAAYMGSYVVEYSDGRPTLNFVFVADYIAGEVQAGSDMEPGSHHWRTLDELPTEKELAWRWISQPQEDVKLWLKERVQAQQ